MTADIIRDFADTTKFDLVGYMTLASTWLTGGYNEMYAYYSGTATGVSTEAAVDFRTLLKQSKSLLSTFRNFQNKLSNCGYWELQAWAQDLNDTLEKITKLPKYLRTTEGVRGYLPYIVAEGQIGGGRTPQDVAEGLNTPGITDVTLALENDWQEDAWHIDRLSTIKALVSNRATVQVETILEPPTGEHIYGRDVAADVAFVNNDLATVEYTDNVEQKVNTLLTLRTGDVPELPTLGLSIAPGTTAGGFNLATLITDLTAVFGQDDLFASVSIGDITIENGDLTATVNVQTKYTYSTTKKMAIV